MKLLGIDGCSLGWIGIQLLNGVYNTFYLQDSLEELLLKANPDICFIDMPVSLSKKEALRPCDAELRALLPPKYKSSVFNTPVKAVLNVPSYIDAKELNYKITGKKISIQSWNILSKIREVYCFIEKHQEFAKKLLEAHPETFFYRLNNSTALQHKKRTIEGRSERLVLLQKLNKYSIDIYEDIIKKTLRKEVKHDDVLDALILAILGKEVYPDSMEMLPSYAIIDDLGCFQNVFLPKRKSYLK